MSPRRGDFFCAEPASNVTDAFNAAAAGRSGSGMIVLEPGESVTADVTFQAEAL